MVAAASPGLLHALESKPKRFLSIRLREFSVTGFLRLKLGSSNICLGYDIGALAGFIDLVSTRRENKGLR